MYKEVFQLALNKGYLLMVASVRDCDLNETLSEKYYVMELAMLQKWLRDTHKICVIAAPITKDAYLFSIDFIEHLKGDSTGVRMVNELFEAEKRGYKAPTLKEHEAQKRNYESALLSGIKAALQLI